MRVTEPYIVFPRVLKSGKIVFYYQFRDEYGNRSSIRSTGCTKLSEAKRFCQKLYNQGQMIKDSAMKFSSFAKYVFADGSDYSRWKDVNNHSVTKSTLATYQKILRNQILPYFNDIQLKKITKSTVKQWIMWMAEKWSAKTTNNAQTVMNIILKSAFEQNLINDIPSKNLSFRKAEKKSREILTPDEVRMIYRSPLWQNERYKKMFLLDAITGMRIGEIAALQGSSVGPDYLNVEHSYNDKFGLGDTKTKQKRYVPIPDGFFDGFTFGSRWVFQRESEEKPVYQHNVYRNLITILHSMGIDNKERGLTLHTVRNFFISYLESKNVPEPKIRAVVGHTDQTMTDVYTYWSPRMFPEVYAAQKELYDFLISK